MWSFSSCQKNIVGDSSRIVFASVVSVLFSVVVSIFPLLVVVLVLLLVVVCCCVIDCAS